MTAHLLLVRHGVTTWNREGRFQGHLDPPLSDEGRREAALVGGRIASLPEAASLTAIVSSPLARAAETASGIAAALPDGGAAVELALDSRLMEIGQGEWEGRTHEEVRVSDAERYAVWRAQAGRESPPGGEPVAAALARVAAALDAHVARLSAAHAPDGVDAAVIIVSHGGALRLAARHLLRLEPRRAWALDVDNCSLSVLSREPGDEEWRLERWNDTFHLLGQAETHVDESDGTPLAL